MDQRVELLALVLEGDEEARRKPSIFALSAAQISAEIAADPNWATDRTTEMRLRSLAVQVFARA